MEENPNRAPYSRDGILISPIGAGCYFTDQPVSRSNDSSHFSFVVYVYTCDVEKRILCGCGQQMHMQSEKKDVAYSTEDGRLRSPRLGIVPTLINASFAVSTAVMG